MSVVIAKNEDILGMVVSSFMDESGVSVNAAKSEATVVEREVESESGVRIEVGTLIVE